METNVDVPTYDEDLGRQSAHAEDHPEHHHAVGDATQGGNLMGSSSTTDRVFSHEETSPSQGIHHVYLKETQTETTIWCFTWKAVSSATNYNTDETEEKSRGVTPANSKRDLQSAHLECLVTTSLAHHIHARDEVKQAEHLETTSFKR